jgi:hypothetical protein
MLVAKVTRRLAPRNRRRSRANTKEAGENNTDVEQSQPHNARRGGRGRRGGNRPGNGYFIEQGKKNNLIEYLLISKFRLL